MNPYPRRRACRNRHSRRFPVHAKGLCRRCYDAERRAEEKGKLVEHLVKWPPF